jgi:hypothetical protein
VADASGLSLCWFAAALPWPFVVMVWIWLRPGLLAGHFGDPGTLALTHAWVLGFLLTASLGAVYQLLPVVAGRSLAWPFLGRLHLLLHLPGVAGMVAGFAAGNFRAAAAAGAVTLAGFVLCAVAVLRTIQVSGTRDEVVSAFALSAGWLVLTGGAGLLLALNRLHGFLPGDSLDWLRLHAHMGLAGVFVTLILGAAFRLLPMFTLGEVRSWGRVRLALILSQGGLFGLLFSFAEHIGWASCVFGLVLASGVGFAALEASAVLATRKKRLLDHGLGAFKTGAAILMLAQVLGLSLLFGAEPGGLFLLRGAFVYGLLILAGALFLMICGMLLKIVPFLVWLRAYGKRVGHGPVPLASKLSLEGLEQAWLESHAVGLVVLLIGVARADATWLQWGAALLCLSFGALAVNLLRIARHLWSPQQVPAAPRPRP